MNKIGQIEGPISNGGEWLITVGSQAEREVKCGDGGSKLSIMMGG